jgi:hypothetical protein
MVKLIISCITKKTSIMYYLFIKTYYLFVNFRNYNYQIIEIIYILYGYSLFK